MVDVVVVFNNERVICEKCVFTKEMSSPYKACVDCPRENKMISHKKQLSGEICMVEI